MASVVAMNLEFLREGNAVEDFRRPHRIVLGWRTVSRVSGVESLHSPFDCPDVLVTTPRTAEVIQHTSIAALATLMSFSNGIGT